jgi:hypothetical protein
MAFGSLSVVGRFWKKYWIVIFFPTATAGCIFSDLAHTRKWKQHQAELKAIVEKSVS